MPNRTREQKGMPPAKSPDQMGRGHYQNGNHQVSKFHPTGPSETPPPVIVTENPAPEEVSARFEDVFATLAPRQQVWLAVRSTVDTDADANTEADVSPQMASRWKSEIAFRFCYDRMASPDARRERDLVSAIERSNAVRAAVEKQRLIMKAWGDCSPSEMRAKTALIEDTLERVSPKRARIEHHSTRSMKELITGNEAGGVSPQTDTTGDTPDSTPPEDNEEPDEELFGLDSGYDRRDEDG